MFGGGGGLDPSKLQKMMDQMGIDVDDIDAEEVLIRTADEEFVFERPEVQRMTAQGQETYQVIGEPDVRPRGDTDDTESAPETGTDTGTEEIPDSDVEIVAGRTGASQEDAREALQEADGDLASAVDRLE